MFFGRKTSGEKAKVEMVASASEQAKPATALIDNLSAAHPLDDEEAKRRMAAARHVSATFGEIVTLLMRTPQYRGISLGDLESLVVPPLVGGQVSVATARSRD